MQGVDDEHWVKDGGAVVLEFIGEALQVIAVLNDGHITLEHAMEFLLGIDGMLKIVVKELAHDHHPCRVGSGVRPADVITDHLGDGGVESVRL